MKRGRSEVAVGRGTGEGTGWGGDVPFSLLSPPQPHPHYLLPFFQAFFGLKGTLVEL